jgi:hypothetical protein
VLTLLSRIAADHLAPLAVHWAQSDMLLTGEAFEQLAQDATLPGPLHIHPMLFGPPPAPGEDALVGIRTLGARHWLGREVVIEPHVLPWATNFEAILAFVRIAARQEGRLVPDGETFAPDDRGLSYRVAHHDEGAIIDSPDPAPADMPLYELVPLRHLAHAPAPDIGNARTSPPQIMPQDIAGCAAPAEERADKRRPADAIGGPSQVALADSPSPPVPSPHAPSPAIAAPPPSRPGIPAPSGRSLRAQVFGRKGV